MRPFSLHRNQIRRRKAAHHHREHGLEEAADHHNEEALHHWMHSSVDHRAEEAMAADREEVMEAAAEEANGVEVVIAEEDVDLMNEGEPIFWLNLKLVHHKMNNIRILMSQGFGGLISEFQNVIRLE